MTWWWLLACATPTPEPAPTPAAPAIAGVTADAVTIGTVLPLTGDDAAVGQAVRDVLAARLAEATVHGRRVELVVRDAPVGAGLAAAQALVADESPFALVAPQVHGEEAAMATWAAEAGVPVVAPFGGEPAVEPPVREVFWVYPGVDDQLRAATQDVRDEQQPATLVAGDDPLAAPVLDQAARTGLELPRTDHGTACGALHADGRRAAILLGPADAARDWLVAGAAEQCALDLWMPGTLAAEVFAAGDVPWFGRLQVTSPSHPRAWTPRGLASIAAVAGPPRADVLPVQVAAAVAAELLLAGLERAGPELDRAGFLLRLGSLQGFDTGLTPRLSYGPRRRVGARGAWLVERDARSGQPLGDEGRWVAPR